MAFNSHLKSPILRNSGSKYVLRLRGAIIWIGQILHMERKGNQSTGTHIHSWIIDFNG